MYGVWVTFGQFFPLESQRLRGESNDQVQVNDNGDLCNDNNNARAFQASLLMYFSFNALGFASTVFCPPHLVTFGELGRMPRCQR